MPVLSLPIPIPGAAGGPMWLPLRIPFPMMRIGSILPSSINEPFKNSLIALFKLAWSNKVQLPVLITVCFMAFDIRMQLEINFFWENPRPNVTRQRRSQRGAAGSNINHAALQAAVVTAALLEQQRQRIELQERARLARQLQELSSALNGGRHNYPAVHLDMTDEEEDEDTDTAEENGSVNLGAGAQGKEKRKKKKKSGGLHDEEDEEEDTENDDSDEDEDDDDDDDDSDDDNNGGASQHPECFGGSDGDGDHDYFSEDNSNGGSDDDEDSNGGGTPLVVQLEIHQRSTFTELTNKLSSVFNLFSVSSLNFVRSLKHESVPLRNSEMQSPVGINVGSAI